MSITPHHRNAARERILLNVKSRVWAARGARGRWADKGAWLTHEAMRPRFGNPGTVRVQVMKPWPHTPYSTVVWFSEFSQAPGRRFL